MYRTAANVAARGINARLFGTDHTAAVAVALADGAFTGRLGLMKPERLYSCWMNGVALTRAEAEVVAGYMDENRIGTRRPVPGVSIKSGELERKELLVVEKAERRRLRETERAESPDSNQPAAKTPVAKPKGKTKKRRPKARRRPAA